MRSLRLRRVLGVVPRRRVLHPGDVIIEMLYVDNPVVVSQSHEQLRKVMVVIVKVCATVDKLSRMPAYNIMCLRTTGVPDATTTFSVEATDWCNNGFVYIEETSTTMLAHTLHLV